MAARRRAAAIVGVVAAVMALTLVWAPGAGAVLAHVGNGHVAGVARSAGSTRPRSRVASPPACAGRWASQATATSTTTAVRSCTPALPYLVFWGPSGTLTTTEKNLFERYFADVAHDSGSATDVYGVDRQFTDTSGFADYSQTWSSAQAITDTHAVPVDRPVRREAQRRLDLPVRQPAPERGATADHRRRAAQRLHGCGADLLRGDPTHGQLLLQRRHDVR